MSDVLFRHDPDARPILGQHDALAAARPLLASRFDQSFKFAFVRNPWDRFVSWFALLGKSTLDADQDQAALADPDSDHWRGFDAFLECWSSQQIRIDGVPRRRLSQWAQLSDAEGQLLTDDLGRFETLAEDAARLLAKVGMEFQPLTKINTSYHHHYSVYYSDFGRELVRERFPEDIQQFGYGFDEQR